MEFKLDKGTGYMYCYNPTHWAANAAGKVLEHVFVMCQSIGRPLKPNECVHHEDRNKTNNNLDNLHLMDIAEHARLHAREDRGFKLDSRKCPVCNICFDCSVKSNQIYCSPSCSSKSKKKLEITREDLYLLVWTKPTTEVAKILGISDVAVAKRCKKLDIPKPPRGYWAKVHAGQVLNIPSFSPYDEGSNPSEQA